MMRGSVSGGNQHTFSMAPQAEIPRSKFNRSHGVKTTFDEGYLVPVLVDEMLPGDTFNLKMTAFARMATPIFPLMDNLYLDSFFFAVPYRLVWDNWERFNGYQRNPGDSTVYTVPAVAAPAITGVVESTICDYMGIPTTIPSIVFNSLHLRAYNLIWNTWFRDENQQNSVTVRTTDTGDLFTDFTLLRRGKRYDYFTSCLPYPQKGPDVELPLGTTCPVYPITSSSAPTFKTNSKSGFNLAQTAGGSTPPVLCGDTGFAVTTEVLKWDSSGLQAMLSAATAATINDLRVAFQTQKLYERDMRGGTRYTEIIQSHFGVTSPDARLQRPEFLGGGSSPVIINPIAQTSATSGSNALGQLAAYGVITARDHGFVYSATEHVLVLGLVCVRADINYQQGLERMWSRQTRLDYYWPALSHLGEQSVLNKEIYCDGSSHDAQVFGYQERYAEYRYKPSQITGLFRSQATGSLDSWHLAQQFGSLPALGNTFIIEDAPMNRVKAVSGQPDFLFDGFFNYICARPMPVYAIPGLIDHF